MPDLLRLDRVSLVNFRGFSRLTLGLEPDVTVLFGETGSGKTNVLHGIRALLAGLLPKAEVPLIAADAHEATVTADLVRRGEFPMELSAEGVVGGQAAVWKRGMPHPLGRTSDVRAARQVLHELNAHDAALPLIAAYGTQRFAEHARDRTPARPRGRLRTDAWLGCLNAGGSDEALLQWWFEASLLRFQHQPSPAYEAICAVIQDILPSNTDGRSAPLVSIEIALPAGLPTFKYADGRALRWEDLSDGFHALLCLAGDIAWRAWTLNEGIFVDPVRDTPGIVLVDEIDLHLHPRWQRQVVPALCRVFPNLQFVFTTHAPLVLSSVENHQVRRLRAGQLVADRALVHGNDPNHILQNVQGTELFSPSTEHKLREVARLSDAGRYAEARAIVEELAEDWGTDHPEIVRLSTWLAWEEP